MAAFADLLDRQELWDAEGTGPLRNRTESYRSRVCHEGNAPAAGGLSFHGFFKIVGPAGEFRFVLPVSGLLEQTSESVPAGFWAFGADLCA